MGRAHPRSLRWDSTAPPDAIPWSQVERFEVVPGRPAGHRTTVAVVKLTDGPELDLSCTMLPFGFLWNGDERWAA